MHNRWLLLFVCSALFATFIHAQSASTGAIRGAVLDPTGALVTSAQITITNLSTGVALSVATDGNGLFSIQMLPPGQYLLRIEAKGMAPLEQVVQLEIGGEIMLEFRLRLAGTSETVDVSGEVPLVETTPTISSVIDQRAIEELPLNGRRFSDLAALTPGMTQDPRGLTSSSTGDLAFGGLRGMQTSFLVDGADNNNGFFAQARGRYRSPYQFSNEVIQEFRVSTNTYGVELGRSGGAVINVATKSGGNQTHGTAFWYVRDSKFNARHPYTDIKASDRQNQFGFTLGGPIRRNKIFYYGGFDQHIFRVPNLVRFRDGTTAVLTPGPEDYEASDQELVFAAADRLNALGGSYRSELLGNAAFFKLDWSPGPRHALSARLNTSRYWGRNNVFFDPSSPITSYAISDNGEETVATESAMVSLISGLSQRLTSHLRVQFSRDLQQSTSNSEEPLTRIYGVINGFGRSSILPRRTREHRLHITDSLALEGKRHSWKFGGDLNLTWIYNYFPGLFGGEYIFSNIRVNPWTFEPQTYGMSITPLRAYAHAVPRYYIQTFGSAEARPNSKEYAWFVQDTFRATNRLALTLGLRYDLQTFSEEGLSSNPLWPASGKVPFDRNNFAPRFGFAYSLGYSRPLVVRGGYGWFFTRIPQIYNSVVETDNGLHQSTLLLDITKYPDSELFPTYPAPLVSCSPGVKTCGPPANVINELTREISSFSPMFRTPMVQQASLNIEREIADRLAIGASYLYVHGQNLIRARDVNLPAPFEVSYPVYHEDGTPADALYTVDSFSTWQMSPSATCGFPPCLNPLARPISELGAINQFESAASSVYHGLTLSIRRRMTRGFYFRMAYTWARAIDDAQDAIVAGRPATVQNSYSAASERGSSVTDQRHRFVAAWVWEPRPFHRERPVLKRIFNDWRLSNVITIGSGRPVNATISGDANQDGNSNNDRLPGAGRNAYLGPGYATTDMRLLRKFYLGDRFRLEFLAETFNLFNRDNKRVAVSDDGFLSGAGEFVPSKNAVGGTRYPAYYRLSSGFLKPNNAYAPRQVQFSMRLVF